MSAPSAKPRAPPPPTMASRSIDVKGMPSALTPPMVWPGADDMQPAITLWTWRSEAPSIRAIQAVKQVRTSWPVEVPPKETPAGQRA